MSRNDSGAWFLVSVLAFVLALLLGLPLASAQDNPTYNELDGLVADMQLEGGGIIDDPAVLERLKAIRACVAARKAGQPCAPMVREVVVEKRVEVSSAPQPCPKAEVAQVASPQPEARSRTEQIFAAPTALRASGYAATTRQVTAGPGIKIYGLEKSAYGTAGVYVMLAAEGLPIDIDVAGQWIEMLADVDGDGQLERTPYRMAPATARTIWVTGPAHMEVERIYLRCGADRTCRVLHKRVFERAAYMRGDVIVTRAGDSGTR